ncbi:MAG: cobalt-precorrin-7 (C(5))-methyltransferase [Methanotrichaceae archaeon]|nr:cobalt-precorrin-7 (C(5))-methyltransferase [Methanotrichaceae archaeon]
MIIVGVGAGPGMLTEEAIKAIGEATIIYGSERAIELASAHIPEDCKISTIEDYKKLRELPEHAIVLSTGDPMLSGLGYLPGRIVPGISSLQLTCARLRLSQLRVVPITVHGRGLDPAAVAAEISRGKCVFLLTDEKTDLAGLCSYLEDAGLSRAVAVLTDLGYPQEKIERGTTGAPPRIPGLSCVMIGEL